jgi:hypothetical protein
MAVGQLWDREGQVRCVAPKEAKWVAGRRCCTHKGQHKSTEHSREDSRDKKGSNVGGGMSQQSATSRKEKDHDTRPINTKHSHITFKTPEYFKTYE